MNFVEEYFVNPILYPDSYAPYNIYNTVVYAIVAIAAVFLIYRFLRRSGVVISDGFVKSIIPFIVFGSILRIAEDGNVLPRVVDILGVKIFPFVTPGIYILTFALLVLTWFVLSKTAPSREEFEGKTFWAGLALCALALVAVLPLLFKAANLFAFAAIVAGGVAAWIAFKLIWSKRGLKPSFAQSAVVFGQALDGFATFIGVQFLGYSEQHLVGNAVFSIFGGPWAFLVLKIVFAFAVVEIARREKMDSNQENYLLLLIAIVGLGPGLRDAFRILAGV